MYSNKFRYLDETDIFINSIIKIDFKWGTNYD